MAAKKRKKKRGQARTQRQRLLQAHARRLSPDLPPNAEIRFEPKGQAKMSEVLEDFVEPYRDEIDDTIEAQTKLLTVAILAWNAALLPEEERQGMVEQLLEEGLQGVPQETKRGLGEIVAGLIERKLAHFAEYKRPIIDFELTETGSGYHLPVMSLVDPS
jgi:hypothetical protein